MISAMTGFLTFLIIVGLLVAVLEYTNRRRSLFAGPSGLDTSIDRDRQRAIGELRAHRD
jgi:hypothetical protein